MKILLTNDDGIESKGLLALSQEVKKIADITIVAPLYEKSATSHSITIHDLLRVVTRDKQGEFFGYGVSGTPVDCVKIAIRELLDTQPDLIISGINHGPNIATNILYSGTVAAALEGVMLDIPSIAVSLDCLKEADFSYAAQFVSRLALQVYEKGLPRHVGLNVNIPALPKEQIQGIGITAQGKEKMVEKFEKRTDPRGQEYFWQTGVMPLFEKDVSTDCKVLHEGKISITPITFDFTAHEAMKQLTTWNLQL